MTTSVAPSAPPRIPEPRHVPELDGVRGLALALVLVLHLVSGSLGPLRRVFGAGWVGVDLFFVLSGFLITRILRSSLESRSFFRNFYARRALRIWPLYLLILAFAFGGTRLLPTGMQIGPALLPFYLTFTQNLLSSIGFGPWALAVTWSLAIEEQFYLVYPLSVRFLSQGGLVRLLLVLLVAPPLARLVALGHGISPNTVYISTWYRLDTLAAGALAALLVESPLRARAEQLSVPVSIGTLAVAAVSCCVCFGGDVLILEHSPIAGLRAVVYAFTFSIIAVGFASLIVLAVSDRAPVLRWVLRNRSLRTLGKVSFGVYLIHGITIAIAQTIWRAWLHDAGLSGKALSACVVIAALGSALILAGISWRFIEAPALRLRRLFPARD